MNSADPPAFVSQDIHQHHTDGPKYKFDHAIGKWRHGFDICKGADNNTFEPQNEFWATDCKGGFKGSTRVRCKDAQSFRVLNVLYAKDAFQVYFIEGIAKAVVDVDTFEVLDSGKYNKDNGTNFPSFFGFARDRFNVYVHHFFSGKPKILRGANRNTITILDYGFAKDDRYVWREMWRLKKADPQTFEVINHLYSKDQKRAFYCESPLPKSDPKSFELIDKWTAVDDQHVYMQRELIQGADSKTYAVDSSNPYNGRDASKIFVHGNCVEGADLETFSEIGTLYYRDKNTIYYSHKPIPGVDADSFEMIQGHIGAARDRYRKYQDGKPLEGDA